MNEIDRVLFWNIDVPKFDTRNKLKRKSEALLNFQMTITKPSNDWNNHERVISFLFPLIEKKNNEFEFHKNIEMNVAHTVYSFHIGKKMPSHVFTTKKYEIY
jgi:hypothetical protein